MRGTGTFRVRKLLIFFLARSRIQVATVSLKINSLRTLNVPTSVPYFGPACVSSSLRGSALIFGSHLAHRRLGCKLERRGRTGMRALKIIVGVAVIQAELLLLGEMH
jgi:hypothetical protein